MASLISLYNPLVGAIGTSGSSGYVEKWNNGKKISTTQIPAAELNCKFIKEYGYTYKLYVKPNNYPNAFSYWQDKEGQQYKYGDFYGKDLGSDILCANWSIVEYNFNSDGGNAVNGITKYVTYPVTLPTASDVGSIAGYTLAGWYDGGLSGVIYKPGASVNLDIDMTFTARWTANTYTLTLNGNGNNQTQTKSGTYGSSITLPSMSRTGYTFKGWATSASGSVAYAAGARYQIPAYNSTLYAVWSINTYTVSYNANGGEGAPDSQRGTYGSSIVLQGSTDIPSTPKRKCYTFTGWKYGSQTYQRGVSFTIPASNVTLQAQWSYVYTKPVISARSVTRCDADGTPDDEGTCALVTFAADVCSATDSCGNTWTTGSTMVATVGGNTHSVTFDGTSSSFSYVFGAAEGENPLNTESTYNVTLSVSDSDNTTSTTLVLPNMTTWIDFSPELGVATGGKIAPDTNKFLLGNDELEVTGEAQFDGNVDVSGSTTAKAVSATSITDSGALTVSGTTTLNGTTNAKALTATSITDSGNLTVSGTGTFGGVKGSTNEFYVYAAQTSSTQYRWIFTTAGNIRMEKSTNYGGTWTTQGWYARDTNAGRSLLDGVYPVGAVYISYVSTSPASLFGGSWTQITGRFLRMANDVSTGGADTHTLTVAQMPSHQHGNSSNWKWECSTGFNTGGYNIPSASKGNAVTSGSDFYTGGGGAHNNMPAYQDLYAWRRTA